MTPVWAGGGQAVTRAYASFVLRCWRLGAAERRITVEHIQSGESVRLATLAEALVWLETRASDPSNVPRGQDGDALRGSVERRSDDSGPGSAPPR